MKTFADAFFVLFMLVGFFAMMVAVGCLSGLGEVSFNAGGEPRNFSPCYAVLAKMIGGC